MKITLDRLSQDPADAEELARLYRQAGTPFLKHKEDALLAELTARFAECQLLARSGDHIIGAVLLLPLHWNGRVENLPASIEDLLIRSIGCRELKKPANTLACLAVVTAEANGGNGVRADILAALKHWAGSEGFTSLVAALRPTRKTEYPLTSLEEYMNWRHTDGRPFDPELRMHWELGASVLGVMRQAVTVEADLSVWERWAGEPFWQSGDYILADTLKPVLIDCENNVGLYEEAKIWVSHRPVSAPPKSGAGAHINRDRAPAAFPLKPLLQA